MKRKWILCLTLLLTLMFASSACAAATVVAGSGKQLRGTPGHNAELHGQLFTLPRDGSITLLEGEGTAGFWIENARGYLVASFDSLAEAQGYDLPRGSYRVFPNLKENPKANSAWVRITVTCP